MGINLTELTKDLGYDSRATLYRHFATDNLEDGIILKYVRALKYAFRDEFPELHKLLVVKEPDLLYGKAAETLEQQVELWKDLYYQQLSENNKLLQELLERDKK
jgi:hypothetical protein